MKAQSNSSKFYIPQFKLDSGELLENVEIAYTTEGRLSESRDNAILVFHALTGSHMLAGSYQKIDNPATNPAEDSMGTEISTDLFVVVELTVRV